MAGDIVAFFGLNDRDFQQGVRRAAAAAGSLSAKVSMVGGDITKSFGKAAFGVQNVGMASFAAVGTATALAGKAVSDYSAINSQVAGDLATIGRAGSRVWTDIGRDISGATSMVAQWVSTIVDGFARARQAAADLAAKGFRLLGIGSDAEGSSADVEAAQRGIEAQDAETRAKALLRKARGDLAAAGGDDTEARLLAVEADKQKRAEELNAKFAAGGELGAASSQTRQEAFRLNDEIAAARKAAIENEAGIRAAGELDRADAERAGGIAEQTRAIDAEAAAESARANAQILLGFETRRLEVDTLRQNGQQKEADLLEARLDASQRIYEIGRQSLLDEEDKAAAIAAINKNLAAREAGINAGGETIRGVNGSLGVGFAGIRGLAGQVFGGDTRDNQTKQTKLQERMLRALEAIERKTGGGAAVFAQ